MLTHLHIRDFAIIRELELEFSDGMTVLTGETGAGKSILLDALGLTLGDRADSGVVRHGSARAEISASFQLDKLPHLRDWLQQQALDSDNDCLLRRSISREGRSRGYINGQPVPIQLLRELGEQLVDIHGQSAHQSLLRHDTQRQLLDSFAGHQPLVDAVANHYQQWRQLRDEQQRLRRAAAERETRLDLLRYLCQELQQRVVTTTALAELQEAHHRLANQHRLLAGAQQASTLLGIDRDDEGPQASIERAGRALEGILPFDERLAEVVELLTAAAIQIGEASAVLQRYLLNIELDPNRVDEVEQQLAELQTLARKHRCEVAELPQRLQQLSDELTELEQADQRLDHLQAAIERAHTHYQQQAAQLSIGRQQAATDLAKQVTAAMQPLGLSGGRLEVALEPLATDAAPELHGMERISYRVTANPGQPPRPLNRVVSGGELSRISLAIQVITAGHGAIPTLIFDEVDVGVGGGIAEMVGRQLRQLSKRCQLLCVTHQPQVAAQGHHHLQIRKQKARTSTLTEVSRLNHEQRGEEIARMLGGVDITDQTRRTAVEMLQLAQQS